MYRINLSSSSNKITKRSILSDISRISDLLESVDLCIIRAKILLQKLWLQKISLNEALPDDIRSQWNDLKQQFQSLNNMEMLRHMLCSYPTEIQIQGFSERHWMPMVVVFT